MPKPADCLTPRVQPRLCQEPRPKLFCKSLFFCRLRVAPFCRLIPPKVYAQIMSGKANSPPAATCIREWAYGKPLTSVQELRTGFCERQTVNLRLRTLNFEPRTMSYELRTDFRQILARRLLFEALPLLNSRENALQGASDFFYLAAVPLYSSQAAASKAVKPIQPYSHCPSTRGPRRHEPHRYKTPLSASPRHPRPLRACSCSIETPARSATPTSTTVACTRPDSPASAPAD